MNGQITKEDLEDNPLFWYVYISCFRAYDDKNEINIGEALKTLNIDEVELHKWEKEFFTENASEEDIRFIGGKLNEDIFFHIEFQECETVFYINDIYIGNLGGHFEAWFFTWEELLAFQKYDFLFLLLLPMAGIERHQISEAQKYVTDQLKTIPKFEDNAEYISYCIINGIIINGHFFNQNDVGIVNNQNHSIRNIEKYPRYADDVTKLNYALKKFIQSQ
ncbi:Imm19 family immunity protein [Flavobacterium cerinum]|uniref:Immunity protein 19 n=1 Tax=Flavobacterium cerinum TaxID=2502784 RepID=A0A444HEI1_9FLAO|nr:Imm19 family immunity protein [Flavobacterium cerinum]RWX02613.1 hypothetical protein EPI11_05225 [Flavobacterium cerinum]